MGEDDQQPLTAAELAAAAAGDDAAGERIYRRHVRLVRAVCRDAEPETWEDATQDVFVRVISSVGSVRDPAALPAWLIRVCRSVLADRRRSRGRRGVTVPLGVEPPIRDRDRPPDVAAAVRSLPERQRLALHLYYLEDEPAEAARAAMGLSKSGFHKLLAKARHALGRRLVATGEVEPQPLNPEAKR